MIPVITAAKLWHWGSFDPARKNERGSSLEGNLLSVSACPEAWQKIARLGGSTLNETRRAATLLDMQTILNGATDDARILRESIIKLSLDRGLLQIATVYSVSYYDDEWATEFTMNSLSEDLAVLEAESTGGEMSASESFIGTEELLAKHGLKNSPTMGLELAIIEWAKSQKALDGVYWDENYDPLHLSAPRGGLFCYDSGMFAPSDSCPDDEEALEGISDLHWIQPRQHYSRKNDDASPQM